jgi:integrase
MRLLAYTFVRTSELIKAEWLELDLDSARWDIPAERMKMGTPHIVPLSRQSVEILRALKLLTGLGRLVFPGANDKNSPMSNNTILFALYRLGYKGRMTSCWSRGPTNSLRPHPALLRLQLGLTVEQLLDLEGIGGCPLRPTAIDYARQPDHRWR